MELKAPRHHASKFQTQFILPLINKRMMNLKEKKNNKRMN